MLNRSSVENNHITLQSSQQYLSPQQASTTPLHLNTSSYEPFPQVSRKELQPHLSRFVKEEIQRGHKALAGPARSNSVSLEEAEDATALEEVAEGVLAEEVPAEKVPAEEVPGSSRSTTHGVPVSSEAVTGGGSRVASGAEVR